MGVGSNAIFPAGVFVVNDRTRLPTQAETDQSWRAFIDYVLSANDPHWATQNSLLTFNGQFLPTILHRLEDLNSKWRNYVAFGQVGWVNSYCHLAPAQTYRSAELQAFYTDDINLRAACV